MSTITFCQCYTPIQIPVSTHTMDINDNFLSVLHIYTNQLRKAMIGFCQCYVHLYKFLSAHKPWTSTSAFCQCYTPIQIPVSTQTMDLNISFLSVLHTYTNSCQHTNHGPQHQLSVSATHLYKFLSAHKPWTSTSAFCQCYTPIQIPVSTQTMDLNINFLSVLHTYTNSCQHTNHGPQHQLSVSATHLYKFLSAHKPWTSTSTFCQCYTPIQIPSVHKPWTSTSTFCQCYTPIQIPVNTQTMDLNINFLSVLYTYTNSCQHTDHGPQHHLFVSAIYTYTNQPWTPTFTFCQCYTPIKTC